MGRITNALKEAFRRHKAERVENALVSAICIIQNEAGLAGIAGRPDHELKLMKWCEELIKESGIDFKKVLHRLPSEYPDNRTWDEVAEKVLKEKQNLWNKLSKL